MAINKLPTIAEYWKVDNQIGNDGTQNTMIRKRFCEILQNLHFACKMKIFLGRKQTPDSNPQ